MTRDVVIGKMDYSKLCYLPVQLVIQFVLIAGITALQNRYNIDMDGTCGKTYVLA